MIKDSKSSKFFKFTTSKIILLGFSTLILIGAFLLCLPISNTAGTWSSFIDALFTSTSSVCVTGLMVYDVAIELSLFGQIIVLFLIQIGGLGFVSVTSFLFLLIGKKIDYATRLTIQESFNKEDSQDVIKTVIIVTLTTFICEFIGFLMILPSMIQYTGSFSSGLFKSLFLAVAAFCNAGIDPMGSTTPSFSNLSCFSGNAWVLIPVMILIFIGGIGFVVITDLINRVKNRKKISFHTKIVLLLSLFLIVISTVIFLVLEWNNPNTIGNFSTSNKILNGFFQSITTRTAGFTTFNQSQMNPISIILCEILMFIGGSPVSMAGGIKTTTFFVLLLVGLKNTDQSGNIVFKSKKITNNIILKAVRIFIIAIVSILIGAVLVYLFEGKTVTFSAVLFESISALATVGITLGITPTLCWQSKIVISVLMFMGRIGMLTIPLAFKQKNQSADIDYADAKIIVG